MNITTKKENGTLTITVSGRLDTVSSPELEKTLTENLSGVTTMIFDLAEMTYTSSAGLRVLLKAQKLMSSLGNMKLIHVPEAVMEILEMTGFTDILTIEASE